MATGIALGAALGCSRDSSPPPPQKLSDQQVLALSQTCAVELCGPTRNMINKDKMWSVRSTVPVNFQAELDNDVVPLLREWIALQRRILIDAAEKHPPFAEMFALPLTEDEIIINNLYWTMENPLTEEFIQLMRVQRRMTESAYGNEMRMLRERLGAEDRNYLEDMVRWLARSNAYREYGILSQVSFDDYLRINYHGLPLNEAAAQDAKQLLALDAQLTKVSSDLGFIRTTLRQTLEKMVAQQEVEMSGDVKEGMVSTRFYVMATAAALFDPESRPRFLKRPVVPQPAELSTRFQSTATTMRDYLNDRVFSKKWEQEAIDRCSEIFIRSRSSAPSALALRQADKNIAAVKLAALALSSAEFSNSAEGIETAKLVNSAIERTVFRLPLASHRILPQFKRSLSGLIDSTKTDFENDRGWKPISRFRADIALIQPVEETVLVRPLLGHCQSLAPPDEIIDHAVTTVGSITLSWLSVTYPRFGISIMAHELGHVISAITRSAPERLFYQQTLQCVADRHKIPGLSPKNYEFQYMEEDFADNYSGRVLRQMSLSETELPNKACLFLAQTGDVYGSQAEPLSLANPEASDNHSSGLFRIMQVARDQGELPKSCNQVLKVWGQADFPACGR